MGHPRIVRRGIRMEDVHYGEVDPDRLLDRVVNYSRLWCFLAHVCRIVRSIPLQG
jgi:hypothetical protein